MFLVGASDSPVTHADPISWKTDEPVWVDQWPLTKEKIAAAGQLVQAQLSLGHIEPSNSPWNSPIFVIKKKSGKWRLLQDLRKVNETMIIMGPLQPGLPSPAGIPRDTFKIIVDLKDCFYTIPPHPDDCHLFAFSILSTNFKQPAQRYHWRVLPQGMANSPTLCQKFVNHAIEPVRAAYPEIYLVHYMNDILLAYHIEGVLLQAYNLLLSQLARFGLQLAPEKVQRSPPFSYLGFRLEGETFKAQKLQIHKDDLNTLNDFQKLLGDINWIRPSLKLTTGELKPLFDILKGPTDPSSPRILTDDGRNALTKVEDALSQHFATYCDYSKPWGLFVFPSKHAPTAVLYQDAPLHWIHLPVSPSKVLTPFFDFVSLLIARGRRLSQETLGADPAYIYVPYTKEQQDRLFQFNDSWALAFDSFTGPIISHLPYDKILHFASQHSFIFPKNVSSKPVPNALTVFTDGSSNGIAAFVINDQPTSWQTVYTSAQEVELCAVYEVCLKCNSQLFNLFTDSKYIAHALQYIETVPFISTVNSNIQQLLRAVQSLIQQRSLPCFFGHLRAHTGLPGPLSAGNALADSHTRIFLSQVDAAQGSHALHHQNSNTLRLQFQILREAARQIVKSWPVCPQFLPVPHHGVNPRGLLPNHLWQMDVTHVPSFGQLKYVHVSIDTFSGFLVASLQSGEATKHCIAHRLYAFSVIGIPKAIKTDNGPGYVSSAFARFCTSYSISLKTGIPYNPQGQGIVERANQTLKLQLQKIQKGELYPLQPRNYLNHALYILNF